MRKPMYKDLDTAGLSGSSTPHLTWEFVDRLKDITAMKVVLKGIVTEEDARLAVEHGVDGVIVSNHGGRGEESGRSTIESLAEVVDAIGGKIPVLIDSGFRRGTDIFKALALGAKGVCIGRPYLWGLAAFGQPGVERALELLTKELEMAMRMNGAPTIAEHHATVRHAMTQAPQISQRALTRSRIRQAPNKPYQGKSQITDLASHRSSSSRA